MFCYFKADQVPGSRTSGHQLLVHVGYLTVALENGKLDFLHMLKPLSELVGPHDVFFKSWFMHPLLEKTLFSMIDVGQPLISMPSFGMPRLAI
jgi:hypothetical protein